MESFMLQNLLLISIFQLYYHCKNFQLYYNNLSFTLYNYFFLFYKYKMF